MAVVQRASAQQMNHYIMLANNPRQIAQEITQRMHICLFAIVLIHRLFSAFPNAANYLGVYNAIRQ